MSELSPAPALKVGGTLVPGKHVYIVRPDDQQVVELLLAGEYCNILTSRQMGKSSLIAHVAEILDQRGVRVAQVDLQDLGTPSQLDDWYLGLLTAIARDLGVRLDIRQWWSASEWPTLNQRLIGFFRDVICVQIESPIVIFVDEIDQTLKLPYADDFFMAIRSMYNQRGKEPVFSRVTFCLVGVASPNELIKNKLTTPFNVGRTIELRDFDPGRDDLTELQRAVCPSDVKRGAEIVAAVQEWTGGHPYLTASICHRFARGDISAPNGVAAAVNAFVEREFVRHDVMPEDEKVHIQRITEYLSERAGDPISTLQLYRRIRRGRTEPDRSTQQHMDLKLSGVVKRNRQGKLVVRNRIYERIFTDAWAKAVMPAVERRVLHARRLTLFAFVLLLVSTLVWYEILYPRTFIRQLEKAEGLSGTDFDLARENYEQLRGTPLYQRRADELWGSFNERRLKSAIELDRITMHSSLPDRQQAALEIAISACDEFRESPLANWQDRAETGLAEFHTRRLEATIASDERAFTAESEGAGNNVLLNAIPLRQHAYRHALLAYDGLKKSKLPESRQSAALLAEFFTQRAEQSEYAEYLGAGILWRLRSLQTEDEPPTRQAITHLLSSDHTGLVRTWGEPSTPSPNESIILAHLYHAEERLLMASSRGLIRAWDLKSDKLLETFQHERQTAGVILSQDERRILSWSQDGTVKIWQFGQRDPVRILQSANFNQPNAVPPQRDPLMGAAFSHDGIRVLTWGIDPYRRTGEVHLWDLSKNDPIQTFQHDREVRGAIFSRAESHVLTWSDDNAVRMWDVSKANPLQTFRHDNSVHGATFSRNKSRVLTWSADSTARLWEASNANPIQTFKHDGDVQGAIFSRDESRILTWSVDKTARLWDVSSGDPIQTLQHDDVVDGAIFNRDEIRVLTWSRDATARLWDMSNGRQFHVFKHVLTVNGAMFNRDESRVLTWSGDDTAQLWDVSDGHPLQVFRHEESVVGAIFNRGESQVLTWSVDNTARLWAVSTSNPIQPLKHDGRVRGAIFSRDENRVLTWGEDGTARLWNASNGHLIQTFKHYRKVNGAMFSRDESRVLIWSDDSTARLWDVSSGNPIQTFKHDLVVYGAMFSRDESRVLTWSSDHTAQLWDMSSGDPIQTFKHDDLVLGAIFSHDESRVLTWSYDNTARLWNVSNGNRIQTFKHDEFLNGARFSRDESHVLTWSYDRTARLWDVSSGNPIQTFKHDLVVYGAMFSRDESRVLTWSFDNTARLWNVSNGVPIQTFKHDKLVNGAMFSRDESRVLTWTVDWLHVTAVGSRSGQERPLSPQTVVPQRFWSRRWPGRILNQLTWETDENRFTVAEESRALGSAKIDHLRLDGYDEPPIEGEPAKLLDTWQDKLGLIISNDGDLVPLRPIHIPQVEPSPAPVKTDEL